MLLMKIMSSKAVTFSLLYRAWQGSAGLLTIPLVAHFLTPDTQGYYYTFSSLVALQSFFELGLSIVISVFASHEWHELRLDENGIITGHGDSKSRLISLGRFIFHYFGGASLLYCMLAGGAGIWVLAKQDQTGTAWLLPWMFQILFSAANLWLTPFLSLLEGCDQVAYVARFRLLQSIVSNLVLWVGLSSGQGLWSLPAFSAASFFVLVIFLCVVKRDFFADFRRQPVGPQLSWRHDLFPMQWRLAVQGLFGYLSFPLFTILVYTHLGAVEAGRMGMTLQIMTGIQQFSLVFLVARAPEFALLAAAKRGRDLAIRCRQACLRAGLVMLTLCVVLLLVLGSATKFDMPKISRVLGLGTFAVFSAGILLTTPVQAIAVYLRSHKKELLTFVGAVSGVMYGAGAWVAVVKLGSVGIALNYLLVTGLLVLPMTLRVLANHCRTELKHVSQ